MSQHYFHTEHAGDRITVLLGWDRPLGHYFMVIERPNPRPGQDDYLYVNLDEPDAFELDLDFFKAKLEQLGIKVPDSMFEQVHLDERMGVGNRVVTHQIDGTFLSAPLAA